MNEHIKTFLSTHSVFSTAEFTEMLRNVLLNPTIVEYYKYAGDETIVVRKLITETPPSYGPYKQASLEKILVDLFGRGLCGNLISRSEYRAIYEDSFRKYNINQAKMFRYARRRNAERNIKDFLKNEVIITSDQPGICVASPDRTDSAGNPGT